jgi:protocatechuate 3,4-dioxygenase alpha subunit
MLNPLPRYKETPSQTGGPYVHIGLVPNACEIAGIYDEDLASAMVNEATEGERIALSGRITDGAGAPVFDCVVEIWQADSTGTYQQPGPNQPVTFLGFGRQAAGDDGSFRFETIKPGRVPGPDGKPMAPHVSLWISARGINVGLHTRIYFADEAEANAEDHVLRAVPPARRETLIARRTEAGYHLDIRLQGDAETVFFDI